MRESPLEQIKQMMDDSVDAITSSPNRYQVDQNDRSFLFEILQSNQDSFGTWFSATVRTPLARTITLPFSLFRASLLVSRLMIYGSLYNPHNETFKLGKD
jgi:hypothetical protein